MSCEEISHTDSGPVPRVDVRAEVQVAITDWHQSPPALALALRQRRSASAPGVDGESPLDGQIATVWRTALQQALNPRRILVTMLRSPRSPSSW